MRIGWTEVLVILAVVLLFFGPKRLPELAKSLGQSIKSFKKGTEEPPADEDKKNDKK